MESSLRPRTWKLLLANAFLLTISLAFIGVGIWLLYSSQNILSPGEVNNRIYVGKVSVSLGAAFLFDCLLLFYEIFYIKKMILIFYVVIYVNLSIMTTCGVVFICRYLIGNNGELEEKDKDYKQLWEVSN